MTSASAIAEAARRAGVLLGYQPDVELTDDQTGNLISLPVVQIQAHGGPWVIHPDPHSVLGWIAAQIDLADDGSFATLEGTYGWLGAGDLEPDQIITNLLEAHRLPVDIWMSEYVSTSRRRAQQPQPTGPDKHTDSGPDQSSPPGQSDAAALDFPRRLTRAVPPPKDAVSRRRPSTNPTSNQVKGSSGHGTQER